MNTNYFQLTKRTNGTVWWHQTHLFASNFKRWYSILPRRRAAAAATTAEMHKNDNLFSSASSNLFSNHFRVNKMLLGNLEWRRKLFFSQTFCYPNLFIFRFRERVIELIFLSTCCLPATFQYWHHSRLCGGEELFNWMGNYAACWRPSGLTSLICKSFY